MGAFTVFFLQILLRFVAATAAFARVLPDSDNIQRNLQRRSQRDVSSRQGNCRRAAEVSSGHAASAELLRAAHIYPDNTISRLGGF